MFTEELMQSFKTTIGMMYENKLRRDIDDTLLEKLITLLRSGKIGNENFNTKSFFEELIQKTDALKLIEKALISVKRQTRDLKGPIESFAIQFFGIILETQDLFVSYKNSMLLESLHAICDFHEISSHCASSHDALICCLTCITKNAEGAKWSIDKNIPEFVFSSFESKSFFVRDSSILYFTTALSAWSSEANSLPENERSVFQNAVKKYFMKLISGIEYESSCTDSFTQVTCIEALEKLVDITDFQYCLYYEYPLLEKITNSLPNDITMLGCKRNIINILIKILTVKNETEPLIKHIVKSLAKHGLFELAMPLAAALLRISPNCKPVTLDHLTFILSPINALADVVPLSNDTFFHILPNPKVSKRIKNDLKKKSACLHHLKQSLFALAEVVHLMDHEALKTVALSLNIILSERTLVPAILKIFLAQISIFLLLKKYLEENVFMSLSDELITLLHNYLLQFGETIFTDVRGVTFTLETLKVIISMDTKKQFVLPDEMKTRLMQILCRKLLDHREEIVDAAIILFGQIISGTDSSDYYERVCEYDIHSMVWDLAVDGSCSGIIKASALNVLVKICQQQLYWESICKKKGVSQLAVANILYQFTLDDDFYVQRSALCSFHEWIKTNWHSVPSVYQTKFFVALVSAVKSLDLDLKLAGLDAWLWLIELEINEKLMSESDIKQRVTFLSESGFGVSMLSAIQDYDESCCYKAASILLKLQSKLKALGITQNCLPIENPVQMENITDANLESFSQHATEEQKKEAADHVLKLTTAQQISNITKVKELPKPFNYNDCDFNLGISKDIICSISELWSCIWAESLDAFVSSNNEVTPQDEYRNVMSLLADIIAAEDVSPSVDEPDCY